METPDPTTSPRRLLISRPTSAGRELQVGTLTFDATHHASLVTEGGGAAVDELKAAWAEISATRELIWKQSRPDEIDGQKVTRLTGEKVKAGDDTYIYAVLDTLERKYGFHVDLAR